MGFAQHRVFTRQQRGYVRLRLQYCCHSLVNETDFYISCTLPRVLILKKKLETPVRSFTSIRSLIQLQQFFACQIAWGKEEGGVIVITDINGVYASHPLSWLLLE